MNTLKLNERNFREFGNIIKVSSRLCKSRLDNFNYYSAGLIKCDSGIEIGLLEIFKKTEIVKKFERHHYTEEVIMPLKGKVKIHLASPEKLSLKKDDIRTFIVEPGIGVKLSRDVWHAIPELLSNEKSLCLILKEKEAEDDLHFTELN